MAKILNPFLEGFSNELCDINYIVDKRLNSLPEQIKVIRFLLTVKNVKDETHKMGYLNEIYNVIQNEKAYNILIDTYINSNDNDRYEVAETTDDIRLLISAMRAIEPLSEKYSKK